jgi:hypothetical protein
MKRRLIGIFCFVSIFTSIGLYSQISIKVDLSLGVNYATSYRAKIPNPAVEKTLPAHSYSATANAEYSFSDSAYSIGFGLGFIERPAIFVLIDQDLSTYSEECNLSSMTFGYDSFYKKQNYCFVDFPIYFKRNYSCGLTLVAGLTFKYYCREMSETDQIFDRLIFKEFNWSPLFGIGYDFNKHLSILLKTEPEFNPFIRTPDTDYTIIFGNFNTMISFGYKFKL